MKTKKLKKIKLLLSMCILSLVFALCYQNVNAYNIGYTSENNCASSGVDNFVIGGITNNTSFSLKNTFINNNSTSHFYYFSYIVSDKALLGLTNVTEYTSPYIPTENISSPSTSSFDSTKYIDYTDSYDNVQEAWDFLSDSEVPSYENSNLGLSIWLFKYDDLYYTMCYFTNYHSDYSNLTNFEVTYSCNVNTIISYWFSPSNVVSQLGDIRRLTYQYIDLYNKVLPVYVNRVEIQNELDKAENVGYRRGLQEGTDLSHTGNFYSLLDSVASTPLHIFNGLFDFEILGVNMKGFVVSLLCIALACLVIKLIIKFIS